MRAQWQKNVKFLFQGTPAHPLRHSGTSSLEGPPLHTPPSIPIHNFFTYIPPILFQGLLGHSDTSSLEGPPLHTPPPPSCQGEHWKAPPCLCRYLPPHNILHYYIVPYN